MGEGLSRRDFLKGAAIGATGAAATGLLASCAPQTGAPQASGEPAGGAPAGGTENWDAEYDVVVLGFGAAGANAAVAACEEGASVLLTDKAPEGSEGGNSAASGQFVMATDDSEQLYNYLTTLMGKFNNWDNEAVQAYCDGCAENFAWMTGPMGGDPNVIAPTEKPSFPMESSPATAKNWIEKDDVWGLGRKGYVYNWHEFPELESGQHCLCLTATGTRFDRGYYNLCHAAVDARAGKGIDVWLGAPGKKLIADGEGNVIGCVIEKDGQDVRVKANGGVVLCTGGFEHNKEMIQSYLQQPYVHQRGGLYNDGDGIKMAMGIGADLWHMSNSAGFSWTYKNPSLSTVGLAGPSTKIGVIVGLGGGRFMNEVAENRHGRIDIGGRWISTPMPLPSYLVHDADQLAVKFMSSFSDNYVDEIAKGEVITGDTLEELAENIRKSNDGKDAPAFDTDIFVSDVNAYNMRLDAGEDADYGRPIDTMVPVKTGPFYAIKIGPTYFNTMGGPRRNKYGQVISVEGYPIGGLFSAGELGSIFCDMYNGSGNLGETMVFGRISGQNAAHRAKGDFTGETKEAITWQGPLEDEAALTMVEGAYKDGTYEGVGTGFNDKITVAVTISGGKIAEVEVVDSKETAGIGAAALPTYVETIVEKQSFDIDTVSGATNTLRGFEEAVNDALTKSK
ncbi:FAD-binding protein [Arabiibacter massiliensis]|uniref:FAD-binding protein n=1 Tax=Arabiibacter massiliensis TaxID=1870985 RepID=UPI0009BC3282|nr:FAD-binding protein [Arabiibacter massiliensis]